MLKKLFSSNKKGIMTVINDMHKRSKRSRISLFTDMYKMYKQGYTWLNYYTYNFDRVLDPEVRSTFISQYGDNSRIYREFIKKDEIKYLKDKVEFNKKFAKYLGREVANLNEINFEEFNSFLDKHPKIFAKNPYLMGGKGVEYIDTTNLDRKELYERFTNEQKIVLEEPIKQCDEMAKLSVNSVNTIRTGTAIDNDGIISILYTVLRVSGSESFLDNASQGGYWTLLSENGEITKPMYKNLPKEYITETNPITGFRYKGFVIPRFDEVKKLALEAASICKGLRYVGWDIAITDEGPILIEGNDFPTTELYQAHIHMEDGKGKVKLFEEKLGIKLR